MFVGRRGVNQGCIDGYLADIGGHAQSPTILDIFLHSRILFVDQALEAIAGEDSKHAKRRDGPRSWITSEECQL